MIWKIVDKYDYVWGTFPSHGAASWAIKSLSLFVSEELYIKSL